MPFGRPVGILAIVGLIAAAFVFARPPRHRADVTVWVSAENHATAYEVPQRAFTTRTGWSVQTDVIARAALDVRLASLFMAGRAAAGPDLVELDAGSIGKLLRPPADDVGLIDLSPYLARWKVRFLPSRLALWQKDGRQFGVPRDVHPCSLTYRKDLFDRAGVDPESARTWDELIDAGRRFRDYWDRAGRPRRPFGFSSTGADSLLVMLRQQGVDLVDSSDAVHLADPVVVRTVQWYAGIVRAGLTGDFNPAPGQNARDVADGNVCALITPDWMVEDFKRFAPELNGNLRMRPLPRFDPADAVTASWGGTMIGIPKSCPDPDRAWGLVEALYLTPGVTGVIPPVPAWWDDPAFHRADPYFGDQKTDELYVDLAGRAPTTRVTPYTTTAQTYLTIAMNAAIRGASAKVELEKAARRVAEAIRFDKAGS